MNSLCELIKKEGKKNINTTNWKEYKISDITTTLKVKKYSKIPNTDGNIAFISCQASNNGIAKMCGSVPTINNAITVSTNGNNFDCFYHDYEFVPSSDVEVLTFEGIDKYNALFLCAILNQETKKYSYTSKAKNGAVQKTTILLPPDPAGNPDWNYMGNLMRERKRDIDIRIEPIIEILKQNQPIDVTNWKYVKIKDLFSITRGKRIVRERDYTQIKTEENQHSVITPTLKNRGVDGFYHNYNCENVIVVGGDVSGMLGFYQPNKCWVVDTCRILQPIGFSLNGRIGDFFATLFAKFSNRYSFSQKANPEEIGNLMFKVPFDSDGKLDSKCIEGLFIRQELLMKGKLWE